MVVAAIAVLLAGCSVSTRDVVDEARARGGGLSGELVAVAAGAVAEDQGVDSVALRSVTVVFTRVVLEVGVPADDVDDPDAGDDAEAEGDDGAADDFGLDTEVPESGLAGLAGVEEVVVYEYGTSDRFGGDGLAGPRDVALSITGKPLGPSLFTLTQAGVERFDDMVATALREADLDGGYAAGATIARPPGGGEPQTVVTVTNGGGGGDESDGDESDGDDVRVTLGPDGRVLEVVA